MQDYSQAFWGMLAAILSSVLVFGGLMMSLTEGGMRVAAVPTPTPTETQPVPTQIPGEPTYTASPTPLPTSTATASISSDCDYPDDWVEIVAEFGDTLPALAARYQLSEGELRKANCMPTNGLPPGSTIHVPPIPPTATTLPSDTPTMPPPLPEPTKRMANCSTPYGWVVYIVKRGDNLFRLGLSYGIPWQELMRRNCLVSSKIRVGQRLYVPNVPPIPPSNTPVPHFTPTYIPPVHTSTSIPTSIIPPTATAVYSSPTPILPSSTPFTPPTNTAPPPTETNTPLPAATATPTIAPTTVDPPTNTPIPDTPTPPPLPTATSTTIPDATDTSAPLISVTPGGTIGAP